jgi:hypothetical protein
MLSYQGKLTDTAGVPVTDTVYAVRFRLYPQPTGGTQFWEENQQVRTQGGLFSTLLGSVTPVGSMPDAGAAYLGMAVAGGAELTPRLRIASAAYAYLSARAANADQLQGRDTTTFSRSTHNHDATYVNEAQADAVTSAMIVNGTIAAADLNQMGAASGQVMKWTGSAWAPRNDSVGGGGTGDNAWVRGTPDSVLYTIRQLGIARGGANNMLYGTFRQSHVNLGVACTTGLSSQNRSYITVGGGANNVATADAATIAGGWDNIASGYRSAVGGGDGNNASGERAAIGGGMSNTVNGDRSVVAGGESNSASGGGATVGGGYSNTASGTYATVGGGYADTAIAYASGALSGWNNVAGDAADDTGAVVAGGRGNRATAKYATVGGGYGNHADTSSATVGGGYINHATGYAATVGGGRNNVADTNYATVGGGSINAATGTCATVGGGFSNTADTSFATVGGGYGNAATGIYATVGGGESNDATGDYATVGGGYSNLADTLWATVGGGCRNAATGIYATVGGGDNNTASGTAALVPGGHVCDASGNHSFAAGSYARARGVGSFVWSDSCSYDDSVSTTTANRWVARARGGVYFYTNLGMTTGVRLAASGSSWISISADGGGAKPVPVDGRALLERVAALPLNESGSEDLGTRSIGPSARDFHAAFGYGPEDGINMADADGVALAAIQALYDEMKARDEAQQLRIAQLEAELAQMQK